MRSKLSQAQPGDLRDVHHQILAISNLLEHKLPEEGFRHDPRQVAWGLGRLLEGLADEIEEIARNWEFWDLKRKRAK